MPLLIIRSFGQSRRFRRWPKKVLRKHGPRGFGRKETPKESHGGGAKDERSRSRRKKAPELKWQPGTSCSVDAIAAAAGSRTCRAAPWFGGHRAAETVHLSCRAEPRDVSHAHMRSSTQHWSWSAKSKERPHKCTRLFAKRLEHPLACACAALRVPLLNDKTMRAKCEGLPLKLTPSNAHLAKWKERPPRFEIWKPALPILCLAAWAKAIAFAFTCPAGTKHEMLAC